MPFIINRDAKMASFKPVHALLAKTSSIGIALAAIATGATPALAANECGPAPSGSVTCTPTGNPYATGITYAPTGSLTLTTESGVVANNTVRVSGVGTTTVTNNGMISTTADGAVGIDAKGTTGVVVNGKGPITTTGARAIGVRVVDNVSPSVTIDVGTISTAGAAADGVQALTRVGSVSVTTDAITATGDNAYGIRARSLEGDVVVNTTGTVRTSGNGSMSGIYANAYNGTATVNATDVIVSGNRTAATGNGVTGINVNGGEGVDISFGSVSTSGSASFGVIGLSYNDVVVNGGNVTTTGPSSRGIVGYSNDADVTISTTGNVTTSGTYSAGLVATAGNGTAAINAVNVTTTGNDSQAVIALGANAIVTTTGTVAVSGTPVTVTNDAIDVRAINGNGTANVRNVSASGTQGTAAAAPVAVSVIATGAATANVTGAVSSTNGNGVVLTGATAVGNVSSTGSITGLNGIVLNGTTRSTLTNAGTIGSRAAGAAIVSTGGPATINNSGTVNGSVNLGAGSDTFNNSGTFNANASSNFGGGTDVFNNSGTVRVLGGTTTPGAVTFTGLDTFNNSGTITLVNGHIGDTLTLPGTYTGTGNGTLAVDVAFGTGAGADRLIVNGAATGSTGVVLNNVTSSNAATTAPITLATGGAGSITSAFTLANGPVNVGFVNYSIQTSTAAGTTSYQLVGTPGDTVFRFPKINEAAQNLWHKSADAWTAHTADIRDAKWGAGSQEAVVGGRLWGIMYGGVQQRDGNISNSAFGVSRTVDTSYQQDAFGGQIGMDLSGVSGESAFVFGVTGGYVNSNLSFDNSADRTSFDVINGGVYASFVSGSVFANALAKYDYYWIDSRSPAANFSSKYRGESYGAQGEIGIRFGSESFFAEPIVSASYVRTDLNSPNLTNASLDFDKLDGLRGKAGLRIGSTFDISGNRAVVYAAGNAVHEFKGREGVVFTSGGTNFDFRNDRIGTYGEGKIGFNITSPGGVTGFIEGFGNYSSEYKGAGGRAGLRVRL